jgi:hypothetical protein
VLRLTPAYFLRTRYNPFFGFQQRHLLNWLADLKKAEDNSALEEQ